MPQEPKVIPGISEALSSTFTWSEIQTLVMRTVNHNVAGLMPMTGDVRAYFDNIVNYLDARDLITEVVIAALKERPRSAKLLEAAEALAVTASGRASVNGQPEGFEKAVRKVSQHIDVAVLRLSIGLAEQCTGSVQSNGESLGTAFLVGADRIMTNWHVAELIHDGTVSPSSVQIRFDFKKDRLGQVSNGVTVGLAPKWLLHHRLFSAFDTSPPGQPDPSPVELDYAVLALERPFGEEDVATPIVAGHNRRGWLDLASHAAPPAADEPIYVLGHPAQDPLTVSMGKVLAHVGGGRRMRHDAWSLAGSSGSPVFDGDGSLVALHHGTEPRSGRQARYNQAIPMRLIVQDLKAAGL